MSCSEDQYFKGGECPDCRQKRESQERAARHRAEDARWEANRWRGYGKGGRR